MKNSLSMVDMKLSSRAVESADIDGNMMSSQLSPSLKLATQQESMLLRRYENVRSLTTDLVSNLSDADATVQSMADASPAKWHLAHTTWFFETFILCEFVDGYKPFNSEYFYLFNSYYEAKGERLPRTSRGMLSRPSLEEILAYRMHVDAAIGLAARSLPTEAQALVELGCHHEEQHQELLLTDILHLFSLNPTNPKLWDSDFQLSPSVAKPHGWVAGRTGAVEIGHDGDGFAFDCEGPRHTVWLAPHALSDRLVTNVEWLHFMIAGGYENPDFWLADGIAWVRQNNVKAPLYWRGDNLGGGWQQFGLDGLTSIDPDAPVRHVSYYEADAYARWAGVRLATEAEWESAAEKHKEREGNLLDCAGSLRPNRATDIPGLRQLFGDVWEWTASAYLPHPGFRAAAGAVGEYNGKFMSGQFVLKGGSCATPRGHVRASYRNFFYPHQRWQFTGVRLAKDL